MIHMCKRAILTLILIKLSLMNYLMHVGNYTGIIKTLSHRNNCENYWENAESLHPKRFLRCLFLQNLARVVTCPMAASVTMRGTTALNTVWTGTVCIHSHLLLQGKKGCPRYHSVSRFEKKWGLGGLADGNADPCVWKQSFLLHLRSHGYVSTANWLFRNELILREENYFLDPKEKQLPCHVNH